MAKRTLTLVIVSVVLYTLLVACGGTDTADGGSVGNAKRGEELYKQTVIGSQVAPGCITCHSLESGKVLIGPSHAGLATKAETAIPGMSAQDYLKESIIEPDAHIVDGFSAGIMYQNYAKDLKESEINDLVAFLLTLK